ncbi:hypothetical protein COCON_G00024070 [Conger conger]|uniref:Uncharacterized protein n=1 Tax=Conger conger TaxID=82655 RepID=A0A9Q1I4Q6_CONCO|nr:hypothetical protein COCON_G00024070 [Conger conger]
MANSTGEGHSMQAPTDLGSASLPPSLTAQTKGSTVDYREQQPAGLRSVTCHSITARSGDNAPQFIGCSGNINLNVNSQPHDTGFEDGGDCRLRLQNMTLGPGASGSDDFPGRKSRAGCSRPDAPRAEKCDSHRSIVEK